MKTKYITSCLLALITTTTFNSCNEFLDMPETEDQTFEKIWELRTSTEKYLTHVYSYIYDTSSPTSSIEIGAADESSCSWSTSNFPFSFLNKGSWGVSSTTGERYSHYYKGVREANIFMQNIDNCTAPDVTQEDKAAWKTEARFLRASYYCELMKQYGPIILLKDELIGANAELSDLAYPRNTWNECMEWVCSELEIVSEQLPANYDETKYYGKPTSVAALSLIARMRLYSARELFNGNSLYTGVLNPDGTAIFSAYNAQKWVDAEEDGRTAIDAIEASGLKLYIAEPEEGSTTPNVYESLKGIFYEKWNDEMIWARYIDVAYLGQHTTPRVMYPSAFGGWGPTQQQVDSYAMANGVYPIVGYNGAEYYLNQRGGVAGKSIGGTPTVDPSSGYLKNEDTFESFINPCLAAGTAKGLAQNTFSMYVNREPRFYAHVAWNNSQWYQKDNVIIQYHSGGNTGDGTHDYPYSGYLVKKFGNEKIDVSTSPTWGKFNWPLIRVAEVYLNYCEALVETGTNQGELLYYLNLIRSRAGVPPIGVGDNAIYVNKLGDKDFMRELVRRERRVELAFEGHRYYDTRQWMIAEYVDGGDFWGMNLRAADSDPDGDFWQRTVIQTRVFNENHYLYPFNQREMDRNVNYAQNYGW